MPTLVPVLPARLQPVGPSHDAARLYSRARRNLLPRSERLVAVSGRWQHDLLLRTGVRPVVTLCCGAASPAPADATYEISERTLARLHEVYRAEGDVLVYTASGTGGMESAISNLARPGDRVVVISAGHFGERWIEMTRNFGCDVDTVAYDWGETPAPEDLASRLEELGGAKVVFTTHSETSTGVVADVQGLAGVAKDAGALVVPATNMSVIRFGATVLLGRMVCFSLSPSGSRH